MLHIPGKGITMYILTVGTGFPPPGIIIYIFSIYTAVLTGAADFFYSTYFFLSPDYFPKSQFIFKTSASALRRVRFFVVGKRLFMTFCHARAPPSGLGFLISKISRLEEIEVKIKYEFADGTVSEVEVEESIGAVIIEDRRLEDNLSRKERYHCYSLEAADFEGMDYADELTPEDDLMEKEFCRELQEVLEGLTDIQKQRVKSLADGLSINEIARREGVAPNAVMKSVKGIRDKLKKFI